MTSNMNSSGREMNNTQTNFFKQSNYSQRDDKHISSSSERNKFKTNPKGVNNWPKIKELSSIKWNYLGNIVD